MQDCPREKLNEIIIHYGTIISQDAERCEYLLNHACHADENEHKRKIFVLIHTIKAGVVKEILNSPSADEVLFDALVQKLQADLWLDKKAAEWAVETWTIVLQGKMINPVFEEKMTEFPSSQDTITQNRLSPLNPLNYFQLLWWVLVNPKQLQNYRNFFGENDEKRVGNWLVSSLTWWPLLLPCLALGLEDLPNSWSANIYLLLSGFFLLAWLFTGSIKITKDLTITISILMSICIGLGVAVGMAGIVSPMHLMIAIALSIALFMLTILAGLIAVIVAGDIAVIVSILVSIGIAVGAAGGITLLISDFILAFVAASLSGFFAVFLVNFLINKAKNTINETLKTGTSSLLANFAFLLLFIIMLFLIGLYFSIKLHIY